MAARSIIWAATHKRRELYVGLPALKTIIGNKIAPGIVDRALTSKGYSGQLADEPWPTHRSNNLFHPVDDDQDHGSHEPFDERARDRSWQALLSIHRNWIAAGIVLLAARVLWAWLTH